ncbi:thioesterase II family protein [Streptomyces sp. NPDC059063]|uniref:thioesterase II family protein n=1 Tax=unclassified Streptomyces TaxID=2593676 RepID=UPI0036768896
MVWTERTEARPFAARRLVCFPHAGGSPYFFRSWGKALTDFEVHVVRYPGRAERISEPPATDLKGMAREVAAELLSSADDRPLAFFGHSMGAFVAYEVAHLLQERGRRVSHFFASAARGPRTTNGTPEKALALDDQSILRTLRQLGGTDAELLDNPVFLELVMPYVTADFRMVAGYAATPGPLDCPVTALLGETDTRVTPEEAAAWEQSAGGAFELLTFAGGHFYLADDPPFAVVEGASYAD